MCEGRLGVCETRRVQDLSVDCQKQISVICKETGV